VHPFGVVESEVAFGMIGYGHATGARRRRMLRTSVGAPVAAGQGPAFSFLQGEPYDRIAGTTDDLASRLSSPRRCLVVTFDEREPRIHLVGPSRRGSRAGCQWVAVCVGELRL
jgi:hypothetical protein